MNYKKNTEEYIKIVFQEMAHTTFIDIEQLRSFLFGRRKGLEKITNQKSQQILQRLIYLK